MAFMVFFLGFCSGPKLLQCDRCLFSFSYSYFKLLDNFIDKVQKETSYNHSKLRSHCQFQKLDRWLCGKTSSRWSIRTPRKKRFER